VRGCRPLIRIGLTVRSLTLDDLAVWSDQFARHHSQAAEALSEDITLDVAVVILGRPDEASGRLDHLRYHVINEPVFVVDIFSQESLLVSSGRTARHRWLEQSVRTEEWAQTTRISPGRYL
jgi:hypothetical protein